MARNPSPLETAPPRQGPALPLPPEPCRLPRRPRTARLPTAGFAALEKKNKLWIWLAFDRSGQRLIDWECGGRDAATLNRLLERLKPWMHIFIDFGQLCSSKPATNVHGNRPAVFMISASRFSPRTAHVEGELSV